MDSRLASDSPRSDYTFGTNQKLSRIGNLKRLFRDGISCYTLVSLQHLDCKMLRYIFYQKKQYVQNLHILLFFQFRYKKLHRLF